MIIRKTILLFSLISFVIILFASCNNSTIDKQQANKIDSTKLTKAKQIPTRPSATDNIYDSLTDPKAYLIYGAIVVFTHNKVDTFGTYIYSKEGVETPTIFDNGKLSAVQLNNIGHKEIISDCTYSNRKIGGADTNPGAENINWWTEGRYKSIFDIDSNKQLFACRYYYTEASETWTNPIPPDTQEIQPKLTNDYYKYDVVIDGNKIILKNDSGNLKPDLKMGTYILHNGKYERLVHAKK